MTLVPLAELTVQAKCWSYEPWLSAAAGRANVTAMIELTGDRLPSNLHDLSDILLKTVQGAIL